MKKILAMSMTCLLALTLFACGQQAVAPAPTEAPTEAPKAVEGVFTANAKGMNDVVEVAVTFAGGQIADVKVTNQQETPGIGSPLKTAAGVILTKGGEAPTELLPRLMVENQSVNIDAVSGATITSNAIVNAAKECLAQAGVTGFDTPVKLSMTKPQEAYDVVVVGGGGSGLAAAIAAAQAGSSVLIVEKNGEVGGDTLVCGAIYNTPDEPLQKVVTMTDAVKATIEKAISKTDDDPAIAKAIAKNPEKSEQRKALVAEVKAQWDAYKSSGRTDLFDTKEWYALQTWDGGDYVANLDLVKTLCYKSFDGLKWINGLGMKFSDIIGQGAGSLWQRTHTSTMQMGTGFISTYVNNIQNMSNVDVALSTEGVKLNKEGDRVVSVDCKNKNGETFTVKANKGVVVSTGGFAANGKMVENVKDASKWTMDLSRKMTTNRTGCSMGSGITLGEGVGANTVDMDQIQLLYLGNAQDGQLTKYPPRDVNGTDQIIFLNKEGKRFTNEGGRRDDICLAVFKQTDEVFYMLESGDGKDYKDIHDPAWRSADGFTMDYLKNNKFSYVGETLEELCSQLGWDAATVQAELDKFNACVDGEKDEFGRTLYSTKLENGPWVATTRVACVHHTMGGLNINPDGAVLDASGNVIPGLFAAGEVTGGIHGGNRLGGNAVVDTVVFGKIAGESATKG